MNEEIKSTREKTKQNIPMMLSRFAPIYVADQLSGYY